MPASSRQRVRSCVVKPPQPHWFFSSSNTFSQSARSRYNCPSVRISLSSEVTRAAYSQTSRSGPISVKPSIGCADGERSVIARSRPSLRRNRMMRRWRLQPTSRRLVSLPCQPSPASAQSDCRIARSIDRRTFFVMRRRNRYARSSRSARAITGSMPHGLSPRSRAGRRAGPR